MCKQQSHTHLCLSGAIEFEEADLSSLGAEGANGTDEIPRLEKPSKTPGTKSNDNGHKFIALCDFLLLHIRFVNSNSVGREKTDIISKDDSKKYRNEIQ